MENTLDRISFPPRQASTLSSNLLTNEPFCSTLNIDMFSGMKVTILAVAATVSTVFGLDTLEPDGVRCIGGYTDDNASYWTGPDGGVVNYHANTGFITGPNGEQLAEMNLRFNAWQTYTSSLPYTVDMYCGQDTSQTLTECTSVEVRYAGQDVMSNADDGDCACGKSASVFAAEGYCACYFDC